MARLAGIKLFKGLDIDLERFESRANWRRFDPEEVLVDFDDHEVVPPDVPQAHPARRVRVRRPVEHATPVSPGRRMDDAVLRQELEGVVGAVRRERRQPRGRGRRP